MTFFASHRDQFEDPGTDYRTEPSTLNLVALSAAPDAADEKSTAVPPRPVIPTVVQLVESVDTIFDTVDTNNNKHLDHTELENAYRSAPQIGVTTLGLGTLRLESGAIQQLSNDEWGFENDGITRNDLGVLKNPEKMFDSENLISLLYIEQAATIEIQKQNHIWLTQLGGERTMRDVAKASLGQSILNSEASSESKNSAYTLKERLVDGDWQSVVEAMKSNKGYVKEVAKVLDKAFTSLGSQLRITADGDDTLLIYEDLSCPNSNLALVINKDGSSKVQAKQIDERTGALILNSDEVIGANPEQTFKLFQQTNMDRIEDFMTKAPTLIPF